MTRNRRQESAELAQSDGADYFAAQSGDEGDAMNSWLRRIRAAILMGLTWAVTWMPVGLLLGFILDPDGTMDEPWILVGTLPGFLAGVIFSVVLGVAAGRRRLDELSVEKVGRWGALAGLVIGSLPMLLGDRGPDAPRFLPIDLVIVGSITLLSALSAAGSLILARKSERPAAIDDSAVLPEIGAGAPEFGASRREPEEVPHSGR